MFPDCGTMRTSGRALEKERRADAGAVVDRHALYGRDDSFHFRGLFYYCKYIG